MLGGKDTSVERAVMAGDSHQTARLAELLEPSIVALGFDVVQLRLIGAGGQRTLQLMAERRDAGEMSVYDCAKLSRAVSAILDVDDPLEGTYLLEVSSPGIDRPLTRQADYERFAGREAKVELKRMIAGQRRFRGRLLGSADRLVRLAVANGREGEKVVELPFADIAEAKLLMTDALLAEALKKRKIEK